MTPRQKEKITTALRDNQFSCLTYLQANLLNPLQNKCMDSAWMGQVHGWQVLEKKINYDLLAQ